MPFRLTIRNRVFVSKLIIFEGTFFVFVDFFLRVPATCMRSDRLESFCIFSVTTNVYQHFYIFRVQTYCYRNAIIKVYLQEGIEKGFRKARYINCASIKIISTTVHTKKL